MLKKTLLLINILIFIIYSVQSQEKLTQTIRGKIIDKQSQYFLFGANVILLNTDPFMGGITDINGEFEIKNVPVGKYNIKVSYVGYLPKILSNIEVNSSKELILNLSLEESVTTMEEVVIKAKSNKITSINKMATVSVRTFSVDETQRFAGTRNDISRMAANYAGVSAPNDAINNIVIRGNSSSGLLWRLEGVDIQNPNHFGVQGATGGPVSMLNNNNLSNSDFFTGAFPAEYGNAISGVFDLNLKNGNNQKFEFMSQIGFNGLEIGAEGPLTKNKRSSFIFNYRYSTLDIFPKLGINIGTGKAVPQYQDLTFKLNFPIKSKGVFNIFGFGGKSYIEFISSNKPEDVKNSNFYNLDLDTYFGSKSGAVGTSYKHFFNKKVYAKITLLASGILNNTNIDSVDKITRLPRNYYDQKFLRARFTTSLLLNKKINTKHTWRTGIFIHQLNFNLQDSVVSSITKKYIITTNEKGNALLYQPYISWQYRPTNLISINLGLHSMYYSLSNEFNIEPRFGLKIQTNKNQSINFGIGLHSKIAPLETYFNQVLNEFTNQYFKPNKLKSTKSLHFVLGYDITISPTIRFRTEAYYQKLSKLIVDANQSSYALINENKPGGQDLEYRPDTLSNNGSGKNYGLEFTLEKFIDKGFYFLFTTSLFKSKYKDTKGIERNTAFNGNYIFNGLLGKEFSLKSKTNLLVHSITLDGKVTWAGGNRYTPINIKASEKERKTVYNNDIAFSKKFNDYLRIDLTVGYKQSIGKITQTFSFNVQNITNKDNPYAIGYNSKTKKIEIVNQLGLFPIFQYQILF